MPSNPEQFPRVPYWDIKHYLGWIHVGTPDAEVAQDIRERLTKSTETNGGEPATSTPEEIEEGVRWALEVHHHNQQEYGAVMSGRLDRLPDPLS